MMSKNCLGVIIVCVSILCVSIAYGEGQNDLVIPANTITENASFIPVEVDGTKMEVIAVRDSKGEIRTAFNTCQVCNGSELAYYKQSGNQLVCQNCGNRFPMDEVGVSAWGCNPYPILGEQRITSGDSIIIPDKLLEYAKEVFSSWKVEY